MAFANKIKGMTPALLGAVLFCSPGFVLAASDQAGNQGQTAAPAMTQGQSAAAKPSDALKKALEDVKNASEKDVKAGNRKAYHALLTLKRDIHKTERDLRKKDKQLSADARKQKREALAAIKKEHQQLRAEYRSMKKASGDEWTKARDTFAKTYEDTIGKLEKAGS